MINEHLDSVKKQFEYFKMLEDKTFSQLKDIVVHKNSSNNFLINN